MMITSSPNRGLPKAAYRSYLLRLWRPDQSEICNWRASVEDIHSGERVGFANVEDLFVFLMEQVKKAGPADRDSPH